MKQKKYLILMLLLIIMLCSITSYSLPVMAQSNLEIEIWSEGKIEILPDTAEINFSIQYIDKIEENSYIADTPGFSTIDVNEIEEKDLANYFIEFKPYIEKCQYADCSHIKEENCGIKKALEQGKISKERYNNFFVLGTGLKTKKSSS